MATTSTGKTTPNRAARRAPAKKAAPAPKEVQEDTGILRIADLEKESRSDDFPVELRDGTVVYIGDPQDLDYRLLTSSDPFEAFEATMTSEDYEALLDDDLKAWQFKIIFESWRQHFGIGTPGE